MPTERVKVVDRHGRVVDEYDREVEPVVPSPEARLAAVEAELRALRERVRATGVLPRTDAEKLRDAIAGPQPRPRGAEEEQA